MTKKLVFLTGTRADYGKIKSLLQLLDNQDDFEVHLYVTGMHLLPKFGSTYREIQKDNYKNIQIFIDYTAFYSTDTAFNLGQVMCRFSAYCNQIRPDGIVVHGDRIEALAGATVGALKNIRVLHIEGGELSGTIDDSLRHAISKLAHSHFVANDEAKRRLQQLGESSDNIYVIGSPDIDCMLGDDLPDIQDALSHYDIPFKNFGLMVYHPVLMEQDKTRQHTEIVVQAAIDSGINFVVIYPNNDDGHEDILSVYEEKLRHHPRFKIFPSLRFEYFLTMLKHATCVYGNSSAGIRESVVYGIPTIDIGSRQSRRYTKALAPNVVHVPEDVQAIEQAFKALNNHRISAKTWGKGKSAQQFLTLIKQDKFWDRSLDKDFIDLSHNEE